MKKLNAILAILFLLTLPLAAGAMEGMKHDKKEKMEHGSGSMKGMEHGKDGGMEMMDGMIMLGEQTVEGVKAMAHVKDVKATMAKMEMKQTHHFALMFTDTATGKPITEGKVAVKIKDPAGNISDPVMLMGMDGHFGADVELSESGKYQFEVGSRVGDEQARQYEFEYEVK